VHFSSFLAQAVSEHGAAATFLSLCAYHGAGNPSTASQQHNLAQLTCFQLLSMHDVEKSKYFYRGISRTEKHENFGF